jgi:hypothetical protein
MISVEKQGIGESAGGQDELKMFLEGKGLGHVVVSEPLGAGEWVKSEGNLPRWESVGSMVRVQEEMGGGHGTYDAKCLVLELPDRKSIFFTEGRVLLETGYSFIDEEARELSLQHAYVLEDKVVQILEGAGFEDLREPFGRELSRRIKSLSSEGGDAVLIAPPTRDIVAGQMIREIREELLSI